MEEITGSAEDDELEAPAATEAVVGGEVTDTVGDGETRGTGAVGGTGLALVAWWHASDSSPSRQGHGDEVACS